MDIPTYKLSAYEEYLALCTGYPELQLRFFDNEVYFDLNGRNFCIEVSAFYEHSNMSELYDELKRLMPDNDFDAEKQKIEITALHAKYCDVFDIEVRDNYISEHRHNYFSGTNIIIPLGEGILNFCYADFEPALENTISDYYFNSEDFGQAVRGEIPELKEAIEKWRENNSNDISELLAVPEPEIINSKVEQVVVNYEKYSKVMSILSEVFYSSLYTAVFPPLFVKRTLVAHNYYKMQLQSLQEEMLELIEFCFDESFESEVLGELSPYERYDMYCYIKGRLTFNRRTEQFTVGQMTTGIPTAELTDAQSAFADKYGLEPEVLRNTIAVPRYISVAYECRSVFDMLYLEFTKMLEQDIRFKKCGRCGRYFIVKGNYHGEYCDRVSTGETRSCQQLAAQDKYQSKLKTSDVWNLYNKYYKRYFARVKVGTIKQPAFKQWQYAAIAKRDDCAEGKLALEDFRAWLDGSFANRSKS